MGKTICSLIILLVLNFIITTAFTNVWLGYPFEGIMDMSIGRFALPLPILTVWPKDIITGNDSFSFSSKKNTLSSGMSVLLTDKVIEITEQSFNPLLSINRSNQKLCELERNIAFSTASNRGLAFLDRDVLIAAIPPASQNIITNIPTNIVGINSQNGQLVTVSRPQYLIYKIGFYIFGIPPSIIVLFRLVNYISQEVRKKIKHWKRL